MPKLNTPTDFEQAVETAHDLADRLANTDGRETATLEHLLSRIAEYHDSRPYSEQASNLEKLRALEQRLAAFGRHWPRPDSKDQPDHWSPMLGGDVHPS